MTSETANEGTCSTYSLSMQHQQEVGICHIYDSAKGELFRKKYPLDLKSLKQVHIKLQMNVMKDWQGIQTGCGDFLQQLKKHQSRK